MALVLFESRVNMITAATPSIGGFLVAYDTLDGVLKQKDHLGVITPIGSGGGIGSLAQTLSIGSTTGTNSIYLDINTQVRSNGGSASLRLDNGSSGNYVELSSSNSITGSTLAMTDNNILLKGLSSSIQMSTTDIRLNFATNQFLLQNNNSYLKLGTTNVLEFTTATSSRASGNRVPAFISSNGSRFSNTVTNSVIIGGSGITGTQSNSVYTPNLIIKDGGYVKGISGDGQLRFNIDNETYLTSGTNIIGILGANSAVMAAYNGIFITDNIDTITTTSTSENAIILSSNTTINDGLTNTVVIGGQYLLVNNSDTVYLGGTVDINNQYKLPISDGTSGQVIKTDGAGNLSWSSGVGTPVITVTAVAFAGLSTLSSSSTYRITDADVDLYGGTEIYLTTNSQGVLNDVGEGKFYNPRYDQTVEGYKIWSGTSSSYATGSVVYWGGRAWSNNSGTNTSSPLTIFFLNPTEWTVVPYTNGIHYNISYDKIKYDRVTDKIIYRDEKGTNIVSTNSENIRYWIYDMGLYDPIKVFQWGNLYNPLTTKGIASQNIVNSYNENINFIGILQTNITMNNLSSQFNMNTGTSSVQDNLILNNYSYDRQSTLLGSEYNMSFQSGDTITIDGNLMVQGTTTTINSENLIVKDPIIVLAASQSGTPILDSGLFVDRGIGATQAFIWDESMDEFKFISTLDGADVSGDISIANYSNVRTGVLKVGTGDFDSNDRFVVSSSGGTVSLVINESGNLYIPITPTTGVGTYSILTRNDITGEVENISSTVVVNYWYSENTTPPSIAPVATGVGSIAIGNNTEALSNDMFVYGDSAGQDATGSAYSNFLGYFAGFQTQNSLRTNIIGNYAGFQSQGSNNSNFIGNYAGFQSENSNSTNSIGTNAGLQSPGSTNSNFIGFHAGAQSPNVKNSNFIGEAAGKQAENAIFSNFFGNYAGQGANNSDNSNFIGNSAGKDAAYTSHANFLGNMAGRAASGASYSNFIGYGAGKDALNSHNSNFIGLAAGGEALNVSHSNFFGNNAGQDATSANNSNFFGERAGKDATNANNSNFLGQGAGQGATNANNSNFIGSNSGLSSFSNNSNFFGQNSGEYTQFAHHSNFFGFYAGAGANDAINSNFFGYAAGQNATGASNSNLFGFSAGKSFTSNSIGSNNIVIGTNISLPDGATNSINIGGVLFGLNTHSNTIATDPSIVAQTNGKIGINVVEPNCDLEVKGHQTFTLPDNNMTSGDVVYFGNVTTGLTPGSIYYYDAGDWTLASASVEASSSGLLAIALGTSSSDGMLLRGFSRFDLSTVYSAMTTLGAVQFLSVTDGEFEEAQPTLSGEVVRVIGYCVDTSLLYFCPDTTWIELL